jgi:nucleoside-diphosphate-sugar epimerase
MAGVKVTITGGTGNTAEYLIKELEGRHELVLFDSVEPGKNRYTFEVLHPFVQGDLTRVEDCERAVEGSDAIIHLAGVIWDSEKPDWAESRRKAGQEPYPRDATMRVNTMGTYYLLDAAQRAGVKTVVMASSNSVLGHNGRWRKEPFPVDYLPLDEEHRLDFDDSYAYSKLFGEQMMLAHSRAHGMRCYAIRPAGVMRPETQKARAESYVPPTEWSDGLFGYVDIRDLARAYRMCLEAAEGMPPFEVFYINAADTLALEDSPALVERLRPDLVPKLRRIEGRQSLISTARAERLFGWRAERSWTEYLTAAPD